MTLLQKVFCKINEGRMEKGRSSLGCQHTHKTYTHTHTHRHNAQTTSTATTSAAATPNNVLRVDEFDNGSRIKLSFTTTSINALPLAGAIALPRMFQI